MATENKSKRLHAGHRERMRNRFFSDGIGSFNDHELLEIFLYFAVPYKNTNEIAHELILEFGSLDNVINADYEKLIAVNGIGASVASMFCFFREFARVYLRSQSIKELDVKSRESLTAFCKILFINSKEEEIRIVYLNDDLSVHKEKLLCTGTPGKVELNLRSLTKDILDANINRIVLTHNHPRGASMPSRHDVDETKRLSEVLKLIDVELVDHIIIGMDGEWSMRFDRTLTDIWKDF